MKASESTNTDLTLHRRHTAVVDSSVQMEDHGPDQDYLKRHPELGEPSPSLVCDNHCVPEKKQRRDSENSSDQNLTDSTSENRID